MPDTTIDAADVQVAQVQPGYCDTFHDGWVHEKTAPCLIIAQAVQGRYEVTRGSEHATAAAGELFLAATGDPLVIVHHGDPAAGDAMRARWLHASFLLFGAVDVSQLLALPLVVRGALATALGETVGELLALTPDAAAPLVAAVRRHELALRALRDVLSVAPLRPDRRQLLSPSGRLLPVFQQVRTHLRDPLTVADLARTANLSPSRFQTFFREHTGRTPMDYVKAARLTEARRLLLATDLAIGEIADRVGFTTQFHFSREFKRCAAVPPLTYRRQHRELLV